MEDFVIDKYSRQAHNELQRVAVWQLHDAINSSLPHYKLELKWTVPVYSYLRPLCYITFYQDHLYIGFMQGQQLPDFPLLYKKGLKMVAKFYVTSHNDLEGNDFIEILLTAVALQESLYLR